MSAATKKQKSKTIKKSKPKKKQLDRIEKKCRQIKNYNKKHGTNLSYGQFDALIRMGEIKWCGGEWVPAKIADSIKSQS